MDKRITIDYDEYLRMEAVCEQVNKVKSKVEVEANNSIEFGGVDLRLIFPKSILELLDIDKARHPRISNIYVLIKEEK